MKSVPLAFNIYLRTKCGLCGNTIEKDGVTSQIVDDDGEVVVADICPACVLAGPQGASIRMFAAARALRERADYIQTLAGDVISITEWCTLEDMGRARLRMDAAMFEDDEQEVAEYVDEKLPGWVSMFRALVS